MNTENNYSGMERKKTENEIKYFLRKRKEVPVNTLLIGINLLVFLLVEVTGSSLDTYHILRWVAAIHQQFCSLMSIIA